MRSNFESIYIPAVPPNKKVFFASDFHLGIPDSRSTEGRENKILAWLDTILPEAHALFLLGDVFDFWLDAECAFPEVFVELQSKLTVFTASHIPVYLIVGNHDRWIKDSFLKQLNIHILDDITQLYIEDKKFLIGHGDGVGRSITYRLFKKYMYRSGILNWVFRNLPFNIKSSIRAYIPKMNRRRDKSSDTLLPTQDHIFTFCKDMVEPTDHHDYYVFGHLHFPYSKSINDCSIYFNIGDWITYFSYGMFDGVKLQLAKVE
ncbi:MAG: hypothetical protein BGO68_06210 [Candidatus Amoebophilus sp. 36-38]|nr:MAG: hypothetical protein BGO68_06210 [Candidatus Amoebophilus sp. 36-38]